MNKRIAISVVVALAMVLLPGSLCARYLNTATGRFQTMDTYQGDDQDPLSLHKYLYAQADPANMVDPSGHDGDLITEEAEEIDDFIIENAIIAGEAQLARQAQQQLASALIKSIAATLPLIFIPGDKPITAPPKDNLGEYLFIWRELDAKDKYGTPVRYRKPALSPSQFRNDPDKDPDGVSNFEFPGLPGAKPYLVGFLLLIETPGLRIPNVSKGEVLGIPQVEATYTEPPFYHCQRSNQTDPPWVTSN